MNTPAGGRLGSIPATTVTITDDDPPPTVAWETTAINVGEPAGSALVAVNLSAVSAFTVTVNYATSAGSATAGSDYTTTSGTLTFGPGVTSRTVSVPILNDSAQELTETFTIVLSSPANASLPVPNTPVTISIIDDESPPAAPDELYTYDALGNITFKTGVGSYSSSAAHPHAVTTAGPFGFGYDANGNITSVGGQMTTWDAENRPTSIQRVSGSELYAYDADGKRIEYAIRCSKKLEGNPSLHGKRSSHILIVHPIEMQ